MSVVNRADIKPVALPREEVTVDSIGGAVIVQGMDLPAMLAFHAERRRQSVRQPGESEEQAAERANGACVPVVLHHCIRAADEQPVYSPAQWAQFGARHALEAMDLFNRAMRLSGLDADAEKKA